MSATLVVTSSACAKRGLPPVGFSFDFGGTGLFGGKFPGGRTYAGFSGPPGGPLFVRVKPTAGVSHADLERVVWEECAGSQDPPAFGEPGELEVAGENRPAVLFYTGQRHPLTAVAGCAIGIETEGRAHLVVIVGAGGNPEFHTDCLAVAMHPSLARVLETFSLGEFEDEAEDEVVQAPGVPPDSALADEASAEPADVSEPEPTSPEPPPGLSAAAAMALVQDIQQAMRRNGLWRDQPPGMTDYTAMGPAQQMAWSLQASLPSVESSLRGITGTESEASAVEGILQMLASWPPILQPYPEAAEVVAVIERGPSGL